MTTQTTRSEVFQTLASARKRAKEAARQAARAMPLVEAQALPALEALEELCNNQEPGWPSSVSFDLSSYPAVYVYVSPERMDQCADVLRVLTENGLRIKSTPGADDQSRMWELVARNIPRGQEFDSDTIRVFVTITGQNCRLVQVGIEERPIYKTVCD